MTRKTASDISGAHSSNGISGPQPLTSVQMGVWMDQMRSPDCPSYNVGMAVNVDGPVDQNLFVRALEEVSHRHSALRLVFGSRDGVPWQRILGRIEVPFRSLDLRQSISPESEAKQLIQEAMDRVFPLDGGLMWACMLIRTGVRRYVWSARFHHLICDGVSGANFFMDLSQTYTNLWKGGADERDVFPSFDMYWGTDRDYLVSLRADRDRNFWKERFRTLPPVLFPSQRTLGKEPESRGSGLHAWILSRERYSIIENYARRHDVSVNGFFLALLACYFYRTTCASDMVIGVPVHNRSGKRHRQVMGMFASVVPVRFGVEGQWRFSDLIRRAGNELRRNYRHQRLPVSEINRCVSLDYSVRSSLYDVVLAFDQFQAEAPLGDVVTRWTKVRHGHEQMPLVISVNDFYDNEDVVVDFAYNSDYLKDEDVRNMVNRIDLMLDCVLTLDEVLIDSVPIMNSDEWNKVIFRFNETEMDYSKDALIHELFERQGEHTPETVAVQYEGKGMTYAQLNTRANQLAYRLLSLKDTSGEMLVSPDTRVAISVERSPEMVVGLLGILKAGAAYVPVDPAYPAERIEYMLRDSQARVLLTQRRLLEYLSTPARAVGTGIEELVLLDEESTYVGQPEQNIGREETGQTSSNLAYVIYTSGSTGLPKGVMVEHRQLDNLLLAIQRAYGLTERDRVLQFVSMSFDVAAQEIFSTLTSGATLVLRNEDCIGDSVSFWRACRAWGITVAHLPAAFWHRLAYEVPEELPEALRLIALGGERLDPAALSHWFERQGERVVLLNEYGPTEATVTATTHVVQPQEMARAPIGRPLANVRIYVLDDHGWPAPVGVQGEICIGGEGVARGYLNRPELSGERFVKDPFSEKPGARMYRTGDLGYWQTDGVLQFAGRNDDQVKIRGFRVELGEIEARLGELARVREAVVVALEDQPGDRRLVAYWTARGTEPSDRSALLDAVEHTEGVLPKEGDPRDAVSHDEEARQKADVRQKELEQLRDHLRAELPEYMVPSVFVKLEEMPLTPNGKVDRKALPAPDADALTAHAYEAPQGPVEEVLAGIWQELLGVERVGRNDSFFDLGGHSLLAVQLIGRMRRDMGQEVQLGEIFDAPTLTGVAGRLQRVDEVQTTPIERADRAKDLPLSWGQQRLWFLEQLEDLGSAYHIPAVLRLQGELDRKALQRTLDTIVARHEALRTVFERNADGEPVQRILPVRPFELQYRDLSQLAGAEKEQVKDALIDETLHRPFDLTRDALVRASLAKLGDQDHVLSLCMHHIVSDGWSMGVLTRELAALYEAFSQGRDNPLPDLPIQYADYAQWQRQWLIGEQLQTQTAYWKEELTGAQTLLELPTDRPRPPVQSYAGSVVPLELDKHITEELNTLARRHGATLFMVLQAGFAVLMGRLSGQDDVVIGTPVANRRRSELEGLIGFFVNTLALRTRLDAQATVSELLSQVKERMLAGFGHQDVPFEQVVEVVSPERSMGHSPLFQVALTLQNASGDVLKLPGLKLTEQDFRHESTHFDLMLSVEEVQGRLRGVLEYRTDIFDRETVERWLGCWKLLLQSMAANDEQRIGELSWVSEVEREQVIREFNATEASYPKDALIHELFEHQAQRTPDAVAVQYENKTLTYAELNTRANQLAHQLRSLKDASGTTIMGPDVLVAISVERSLEMVVGLLGILKAGAAYVPVDPAYPAERMRYILEDSKPVALLTHSLIPPSLREQLKDVIAGLPLIELDESSEIWQRSTKVNLPSALVGVQPSHLAYVIYTSGSTGLPKGVMVEHQNVVRLFSATQEWFHFDGHDVWTLFHSFAFDFSVWEIWGALLHGGRLVVVPYLMSRSPNAFYELLRNENVTVLNQTPSAFRLLMTAQDMAAGAGHRLRVVIFGGEVLEPSMLAPWYGREQNQNTQLVNMYGITETTVHVTYRALCIEDLNKRGSSPIGVHIPDMKIYVLDVDRKPVPIGVKGELYVGGPGVARGYLNRVELTAERFMDDPFSDDPNARMYRTGDLGKWRADGQIEYLGRNDFQIKIRGLRIELGEIETRLAELPEVRDAVVLAREDQPGDKRLVAYWTARPEEAGAMSGTSGHEAEAGDDEDRRQQPDVERLRNYLRAELPSYMVPSAFVKLEAMPLTPHGKVDRKALPAPGVDALIAHVYEVPQGPVEEVLAGIWQELLGVERVGRNDSFFDLGGHSLLIVSMVEKLRQAGLKAEIRQVFQAGSLADLAAEIRGQEVDTWQAPANLIPQACTHITSEMLPLVALDQAQIDRIAETVPGGMANIQDIYPLAPLQEGVLFYHRFHRDNDPYVLSAIVSFASMAQFERFAWAMNRVVARHDVLRTAILWEGLPQAVQVVYRHAELMTEPLEVAAESDELQSIRAYLDEAPLSMNLAEPPLLSFRPVRMISRQTNGDGQCHAVLMFHHVVLDHVSMDVMLEEVARILEGEEDELLQSIPYRGFVAHSLDRQRDAEAETFFWQMLGDVDEPTAPFGMMDVHGDGAAIREEELLLDSGLSQRIRTCVRMLGMSAAILFHVAYALVLARCASRDDVVFGSVLSGRMGSVAGADRMLGMFINTLPVRLKMQGTSVIEAMRETQSMLVGLLKYEQTALALAQRCSGVASGAALFSAVLNFRHSQGTNDLTSRSGIEVVEPKERTNYPFVVSVDDLGAGGFALIAQTDARVVEPERVLGYLSCAVLGVVQALEAEPKRALLQLEILSQSEKEQLVHGFNATAAEYPKEALIHDLFEQQAERTPQALAAQYEGQSLTYAQLNTKANQLAHWLLDHGVGRGQNVAIVAPRGIEMLLAQLATLKAGGTYVPVDPEFPQERRRFMLEDCQAKVVLFDGATAQEADATTSGQESQWLELGRAMKVVAGLSADNPAVPKAECSEVAYVMYTSGSTGKPKGVMTPHHGVNRLVFSNGYADVTPEDVFVHFSNPTFDGSTFEVWGALLNGARVVIVPQDTVLDPVRFGRLLLDEGVTAMYITIGLFHQYADALAEPLSRLKYLLTGGDVIEPNTIRRVLQYGAPKNFMAAYGPTETTTFATTCRLNGLIDESCQRIPLGKPIGNTQIYILDGHGQLVPVGVTGEIYIGGDGVALGYLNRPDLTAERFIPNPFSDEPNARMYRSGDLGYWREDGLIEFVGRNDFQVKIRGFRIELGEIEARLGELPQVKEVVVLAREDHPGDKRLVAYWTAREELAEEALPDVGRLRDHLKAELPEYMVPSAFMRLETMPLNTSGKVDRKALPAPDVDSLITHMYEAPQGPVEEVLAGIWQELLGVERVGRHDNFFDLGGHSLLVMSLLSRMKERGLYCSVAQVFRFPTIAQQEHFLLDESQVPTGGDCLVPMRPGGSEDAVPLFLIHEVSGTVMAYVPMVSLLAGDFPVYGLHAMNFDLEGKEFLSVKNMASSYIEAIRKVQPSGPYRLFGWSAGGLIAYEIGRQLIEIGEDIDFIIMIDTYVHCSFGLKSSDVDFKGSAVRFIDRIMSIDRSDFKRMMNMGSVEEVIDEYYKINGGDAVSRDDLIRRVNVEHRITKSVFDYRPKAIDGDVYFFLAPEVTQDMLDVSGLNRKQAEYVRGWEFMKEQGPTVISIGGNHDSIMQPPHLQKVVDMVGNIIRRKS